jgi:dimethylglycine dehydrogenase
MKWHARAEAIGDGIAGRSALYHLTKLGWKDVVICEGRELSNLSEPAIDASGSRACAT